MRFRQSSREGGGVHAVVFGGGHCDDGVEAQAQHGRRLLNAEVAVHGGENPEAVQQVRQAGFPVRGPQLGDGMVAGNQQRLEVGLAAAGGEHAVSVRVEADALRGPIDEAALDHGGAGALVPGVHGGVHRRKHGFANQRRDDHRAVQVRGVAGIVEVDGVLEVELVEFFQGCGGVRQRTFKVHGTNVGLQFGMPDAGKRLGGPLDLGGDSIDSLKDLRDVAG